MCRSLSGKGRPAFSLAEIMIALAFVTLALFALISVNAYNLRAARGSRSRQIASVVATTQLASIEARLKVDFHQTVAVGERTPSTQFPDYAYTVTDLGYENPEQTLRRVQVDVFWNEDRMERTYQLATTFYYY